MTIERGLTLRESSPRSYLIISRMLRGIPYMAIQPATVLIVDDEAAVRRLVARSLPGVGFSVQEAENGVSALRLLEAADPVHLVISDIHMPAMDGLALARDLRALRPLLSILFITGRESPGGRCRRRGARCTSSS